MSAAEDAAGVLAIAAPLVRMAADVIEGRLQDRASIARSLIDAALDHMPVEELAAYLSAAARIRADAAFEVAKALKLNT